MPASRPSRVGHRDVDAEATPFVACIPKANSCRERRQQVLILNEEEMVRHTASHRDAERIKSVTNPLGGGDQKED